MTEASGQVGVVAIGRNEGERLKRCLAAAVAQAGHVVYVDSGSTDGSVDYAKSLGVEVVELDLSTPFTAARARNAGYRRLIGVAPRAQFVQFVDGDCELVAGYIAKAHAAFENKEKLAVVCGRRRERHREATLYNRLCDMEWDTPIGAAKACHGDAMMRRKAFEEAGMFDEAMIAGEEPELCVRLRAKGWTLDRIDAEMTLHDAAMTMFSQWYKRMVRAGHAYAEGAAKHGAPPERHNIDQVRSTLVWGLFFPIVTLAMLIASFQVPWLLLGVAVNLLLLFALYFKIRRYRLGRGDTRSDARWYALFTILGKVPLSIGILKYAFNRLRGKQSQLIEYKSEGALRG